MLIPYITICAAILTILGILIKITYDAYVMRKEFDYRRCLIEEKMGYNNASHACWKDYKNNPPTNIDDHIILTNGVGLGIVRHGDYIKAIFIDSHEKTYFNNRDHILKDVEKTAAIHWMTIEEGLYILSQPKINIKPIEQIAPKKPEKKETQKPVAAPIVKNENSSANKYNLLNYMKINDAADMLGVSANTLRNWETTKNLKCYRNPNNKYRLYKKEDIEKLLKDIESTGTKVK